MNKDMTARPKSQMKAIIVLGIISALTPFSIDMYLPALPEMTISFGTTTFFTQLTLTIFMLGLAIGQLVAGPISDAIGRRRPLMVGMALYAVVSLLCVFAPSIEVLLVLRFIQGLAGATGIVISRAIARDSFDGAELTKFIAYLSLIGGAGPIIAPVLGGQLLLITTWQGIFVILTILGAIVVSSMYLTIPESLPQRDRIKGGMIKSFKAMGSLMLNRELVGYSIVQGLLTAGIFSYVSRSTFVFQEIYNVSAQTFSILFAVIGSGIIIGVQLTVRLVSRYNEQSLLFIGLIISTFAGIFLFFDFLWQAKLIFIVPPLFVLVACVGMNSTLAMSLALHRHKQSAGSAAGLLGVISMLLGVLISPLSGLGGNETTLPLGLVIGACSVGALLCYILLIRRFASSEDTSV